MAQHALYPAGPAKVPADLTKPRRSYRRQALLAMLGLTLFMLGYIALGICFGMVSVRGIEHLMERFDWVRLLVTVCASLLTLFMAKSLLTVRKGGNPGGIEVSAEQQPELFAFVHQLADDIGAPRPHRVFLTPEVNAAVFYDLSLMNLLLPSKKNLIIGLGLVNVLSLGELKAVLAHEFGHFAQRSMMVGRWVYIAQQIIGHMVSTRDWLDKIISFISRTDPRIAWVGWLLGLAFWSIRAVMDSLFRLVLMAERALSREMEFNADLVAVSVTGSDALVNALHKLQAADHGWQTAIDVARSEAGRGKRLGDLFSAQHITLDAMRTVLDDPGYGKPPAAEEGCDPAQHRVFDEDMARPPQMWASHPANRDREDNAKACYIAADIDHRSAWVLFSEPEALRQQLSRDFYNPEKRDELEPVAEQDAVMRRFSRQSLHPRYRGNYLDRDLMRNFASLDELLQTGAEPAEPGAALASLYPQSLKEDLASARNLDIEIATLKALQRGELQPSGGVIRHRGEEIKKDDIPRVLKALAAEHQQLAHGLKEHDALCHRSHLQAAASLGQGWEPYLKGLLGLLHACEHMAAVVRNEQALLANTWLVITADGQVGYFEKKRMLKVATSVGAVMETINQAMAEMVPTQKLLAHFEIENWRDSFPEFGLVAVDKHNWGEWCPAAHERMDSIAGALEYIRDLLLDDLIEAEGQVEQMAAGELESRAAPTAPAAPPSYPVLMPGSEHQLQRRLDLWNRFQLAHGTLPTLARLLVSIAIVGGTLYGGWVLA
ncbi:M48 family metallopeptidase [Gallaecimonas pentaromativorans]|uniref:Zn-dependent protease with chaperone function n=1 Tax=Gallaecimonas pentaromativorans TaxID=584787 RepID=A0A3N1PPC3_9GAMM|nr:M48 family metallopeptidase [Gallaecimonas pentaromativorans]ROQ30595.1 Zn-dependent protease with chaperone function [Gallaecimonas pentaromativorans]